MTVDLVIPARRQSLGGFEVGRVLPFHAHRMVGPYIFFDHMGPMEMAAPIPRTADVRPHPHIGLATVTYLFAGEMTHRDSTGVTQDIRPGEVNWMTAGQGITHSERFDGLRDAGGAMHGIQAWVALPNEAEEAEPAFDHYGADNLIRFDQQGVKAALIAGAAYGQKSSVRTRSPLHYVHADLERDARFFPPSDHTESAAYVVRGAVTCEGRRYESGQMTVFKDKTAPALTADEASTVLFIGGEPVGERHIFWNFVSSSKERLEAAKADWKAQRFKLPPNDKDEFTPLPEPKT